MSVESVANRRRKRIVEHVISGFTSANQAIIFGNTIERIIIDRIGRQKFRQSIGAPDTLIAITSDWQGPTILKTTFLELEGDEMAQYICKAMKNTINAHNKTYRASVRILKEETRMKPQPQTIGFGHRPISMI